MLYVAVSCRGVPWCSRSVDSDNVIHPIIISYEENVRHIWDVLKVIPYKHTATLNYNSQP